ncbi:MAG: formylglycine-generating enzyme family protein [Planctomycetota bacterium]|nr:MAG: formylglycine-generating enzyme family protein [Planctomycetota bacterium]
MDKGRKPADNPVRGQKSAVGRADLLRVWAEGGQEARDQLAAELGYQFQPKVEKGGEVSLTAGGFLQQEELLTGDPGQFAPLPFLYLAEFESKEEQQGKPKGTSKSSVPIPTRPKADPPTWPDLCSWSELAPRLETLLSKTPPKGRLDEQALVDQAARLELPERMPRHPRRRLPETLTILADRTGHLTPLYQDQAVVAEHLAENLHGVEVQTEALCLGMDPLRWYQQKRARGQKTGDLLVLGDLGVFAETGTFRRWENLARLLAADGHRALAVIPFGGDWAPAGWQTVPWDVEAAPPNSFKDELEVLRGLLSVGVRLHWGLIRQLRRRLGLTGGATLELELARHAGFDSRHVLGPVMDEEERQSCWQKGSFEELPEAHRRAFAELLQIWNASFGPEIWFEEVLNFQRLNSELMLPAGEAERAASFFQGLEDELRAFHQEGARGNRFMAIAGWLERARGRSGEAGWGEESPYQPLGRAWQWAFRDLPGFDPPRGLNPDALPPEDEDPTEAWEVALFQTGNRLRFRPPPQAGDLPRAGESYLATLPLQKRRIYLEPAQGAVQELILKPGSVFALDLPPLEAGTDAAPLVIRTDLAELKFNTMQKEDWQCQLFRDQYGLACTFDLAGVEHRMRWIPPGEFWMGSTEEEQWAASRSIGEKENVFSDEGPRHRVEISEGFWLGEVPVTQKQWQAVMGENRSSFKGEQHPVEQVSWLEVQKFLKKAMSGLEDPPLRLPLECEWERACRAGTLEATYGGELEYESATKAAVLDDIAWYSGNGGRETHPVKEKRPNPWGLYDLLGNVWEWCLDGRRDYQDQREPNPVGSLENEGSKCLRGGSWGTRACNVRAAIRGAAHPVRVWNDDGFRLARGPGALQASRAEPEGEPPSAGRRKRPSYGGEPSREEG